MCSSSAADLISAPVGCTNRPLTDWSQLDSIPSRRIGRPLLLPFTAMAEQIQREQLDARVAGLRDQLKLLADYL
jgi:hypothetical protein